MYEDRPYRPHAIYSLLEDYQPIKENYYMPPDHILKIYLLDIERAFYQMTKDLQDEQIFDLWTTGASVKEIAKAVGIGERKVYRDKWRLVGKLANYLNQGE